jgi:prophage antirepressor-like protein
MRANLVLSSKQEPQKDKRWVSPSVLKSIILKAMKKLFLCLLLGTLFQYAKGQNSFFVYFETEDNLPFYIKMKDEVFRSSPQGGLTLPQLTDSTYSFVLGWPTTSIESRFSFQLDGADRGYWVKLNSGHPLLAGMFSNRMIHPVNAKRNEEMQYVKREDAFSAMLAKASGDTTLLYNVVSVKATAPEKATEIIKESKVAISADTIASVVQTTPQQDSAKALPESQPLDKAMATGKENEKDSIAINPSITADSVTATSQSYKKSSVRLHSESSANEGFGLVFIDRTDRGEDTIRLLIPNPKFIIQQSDTTKKNEEEKLFVQRAEVVAVQAGKDSSVKKSVRSANNTKPLNSCKAEASETDFFKLRKNMAAKEADEPMIEEAQKMFRSKCFSTSQIKNLSVLFLTSAGKFSFFEAAYNYVTDKPQFKSLASELSDAHYQQRFQLLIGE